MAKKEKKVETLSLESGLWNCRVALCGVGSLERNRDAVIGLVFLKFAEVNKLDRNRFDEEDLIGRVYEYFLQIYAASGTKEDGEFYTPASVVKLITELIEPYDGVVYENKTPYLIHFNGTAA
ncbi:MAG: N-6 DNA methylase [Peptococcus niger]|nr:N-6 DNA methylase [Peptococcus niger]